MDKNTANRILGTNGTATRDEIDATKHRLLQVLHPDRHPLEEHDIFAKLQEDIIEAAELLQSRLEDVTRKATVKRSRALPTIPKDTNPVMRTLYDEKSSDGFERYANTRPALVKFPGAAAIDKWLAIGVRGIDHDHSWITTNGHTGDVTDNTGVAIHVMAYNPKKSPVRGFYLGQMSFLIDDKGQQYSPSDTSFYWLNDDETGSYNRHSDFIAPRSRIEGFVLFPSLRQQSKRFVRYVIEGNLDFADGFEAVFYDVRLKVR
jgi:hypothetical protein